MVTLTQPTSEEMKKKLVALRVTNPSAKAEACKQCGFDPWARKIPWSRKWQPTPVLLPEKFHRQMSLEGYSPWVPKTVRHDWVTTHTQQCKENFGLNQWQLKCLTPWKESCDHPRQHSKKQRHYFTSKGLSSQGYGFSGSHVWMWELDYKESWAPKNWCFWTVVLEKTLENPLDCILKEISPGCSL